MTSSWVANRASMEDCVISRSRYWDRVIMEINPPQLSLFQLWLWLSFYLFYISMQHTRVSAQTTSQSVLTLEAREMRGRRETDMTFEGSKRIVRSFSILWQFQNKIRMVSDVNFVNFIISFIDQALWFGTYFKSIYLHMVSEKTNIAGLTYDSQHTYACKVDVNVLVSTTCTVLWKHPVTHPRFGAKDQE